MRTYRINKGSVRLAAGTVVGLEGHSLDIRLDMVEPVDDAFLLTMDLDFLAGETIRLEPGNAIAFAEALVDCDAETAPAPPPPPPNAPRLNADETIAAVKGAMNLTTLEAFVEGEERKTVLKAIEERRAELEAEAAADAAKTDGRDGDGTGKGFTGDFT